MYFVYGAFPILELDMLCSITFWKNGFSVDDGPLRDPTDPENKAFLSDINEVCLILNRGETQPCPEFYLQGRVPREFQGQAEPYVSIISRATEDYKVPCKSLFSPDRDFL